jgi:hypothetical protein
VSDEGTCKGCGAALVWALTRDGKPAPITKAPKDTGNVLLFVAPGPTGERVVQCRTFAGFALDELREQGVPLRLNHFADCPDREQFARGGR